MNGTPAWVTPVLMVVSIAMFAACMWSARRLIGWTAACGFAAIALPLGWFAEQMGSTRGWFFGQYHYTEVLGPRLGDVPLVIPLMWFALAWVGCSMARLMLWRDPATPESDWPRRLLTAWLAAMIITSYDLGADPYLVYVVHAWIMQKTDGGWFGETLEGFVGWMTVSFVIVLLALWRVQVQPSPVDAARQRHAALVPLAIYGTSLVFQMIFGHPVETRAIAFFAMGIPLVAALAAWWQWQPAGLPSAGAQARAAGLEPALDAMSRQADPLADDAVARLIGPWDDAQGANGPGRARLAQATREMALWTSNGQLAQWQPAPGTDAQVSEALRAYLEAARQLPAWADPARIARAEAIFMEQGPLSCTLLFCASLPQCYVVPYLAEVLHIAGQLEAHTEYRIRQTAAMIFPVMLKGGLTDPSGSGIAQILKVRLTHATIRHLILRANPADVHAPIPPRGTVPAGASLHESLGVHGWDLKAGGLPCNQFELAYTLLTFSYVFLQGMRTMGLALPREDEEACLHAWNVMGHVLGLRDELMAHTMDDAAALFERMQAHGRARPVTPDVRPGLGKALVGAMARTIRLPVIRSIPVPMTRWLIGAQAADEVGIGRGAGLLTRGVFVLGRGLAGAVDGVVRLVAPRFSLSRMITRVIGYHLLTNFLLDQTRPIGLPPQVLNPLQGAVATWGEDPSAGALLNWIEDRMTTPGPWRQRQA